LSPRIRLNNSARVYCVAIKSVNSYQKEGKERKKERKGEKKGKGKGKENGKRKGKMEQEEK